MNAERAGILLVGAPEGRPQGLEEALSQLASLRVVESMYDALVFLEFHDRDVIVLCPPIADSDVLGAIEDLAMALPGRAIVAMSDAEGEDKALLLARGGREVLSPSLSLGEIQGVISRLIEGRDFRHESIEQVANLYAILAALESSVLVHSPTGRLIAINSAAYQGLVAPVKDVLYRAPGPLPVKMVNREGKVLALDEIPINRALRTGEVASEHMRVELPGSTQSGRWLEGIATPIFHEGDDRPYGIVQTFRDVTAAHEAEDVVELARRREQLLLEHATEGYVVLDARGNILDASAVLRANYALEQIGTAVASHLLHPDDVEAAGVAFAAVQEAAPGDEPQMIEIRLFDRSGNEHWVEAVMSNRLDEPAVQGIVINLRDSTRRHQVLETMARLSAIVEYSDDAIYTTSNDGIVLTWNRASERLFGYSAEEAIGTLLSDLTATEGDADAFVAVRNVAREGKSQDLFDRPRRRKDGTVVVVSIKTSPVFDSSGKVIAASSIVRDVTERRRLEAAQRQAEERFRLGFERAPIGIAILDTSLSIQRANLALGQMLGLEESVLLGRQLTSFLHPADLEASADAFASVAAGSIDSYHADRQFVHANGSSVWTTVQVSVIPGEASGSAYLFVQVQDISDRKRGEEALTHLALHDALTGLPNRALLSERLGQSLERAKSRHKLVAVLFLDIDRFKLVNDGLGHVAGDQLLQDLARRLEHDVRSSDTVARFGGDEFIIVVEDVRDEREAESLGARILSVFDDPFTVEGQRLVVSASCGIVVVRPGANVVEVLRDADAAMYRAKALGGARSELFDEALRAEVSQRYEIERELAFVLERGELAVAYQPILSMADNYVVGVEALVRWNSSQWGPLLPGQFIATAEETGLVVPISEFVMQESLANVVRWRRQLPHAENLWVSLNLSARTLATGDQTARCQKALAVAGAPADALRLELTESTVMHDVDAAIAQLRSLQAAGIQIAIDDFGTGQSSLSYLSRIPADMLKIDQSLVAAPQDRPADAAIVAAIAALSGALGLDLCAEGVESEQQRAALASLGCQLGQGYLFAPPMAPEQFVTWALEHMRALHST